MLLQAVEKTGRDRAVRWFGPTFAATCAALIFFGFSFTFMPDVINRARPIWLYLHVAAAAAWLLLVVAQAVLAMRRKLVLHRRIGAYGFVLGAFAAFTAIMASLVLRHNSVLAHPAAERTMRIAFLSIPLNGAVAFSVLLACSWVWRQHPPIHRRCMLLATAVLTAPAISRIPGTEDLGPLGFAPTDLLVLSLCAVDWWREGAVHRVYWLGGLAVVALQVATTMLLVTHPAWWVKVASVMIGV